MSAPIRVLELRSVWGTGGGPEKTILLGAQRRSETPVAVMVCYIRDLRDRVFSIDRRARELGVDYTEISERHSFDPGVWPALRQLIRKHHIQIVHSHEYKTDLLAWALGRYEAIVPLSTAHGWAGKSWRERLYYAFEKRLLARFPKVIAVSEQIKAELVRTGSRAERVTVIPNAIDCQAFRRNPLERNQARHDLGFASDDLVIGAVGRLEEEKRFDVLLEACAALRERWPRLRLAIVGEGTRRTELEQATRRLALDSICRLVGHRDDVARLHNGFDVFVQSSSREGSPNAVLEAMALETPVVATDVGGTSAIVADGVHGLLVKPGDARALETGVERVLLDPAGAQARALNARQRIEQELSFESRMRHLDGIYQELVAGAEKV